MAEHDTLSHSLFHRPMGRATAFLIIVHIVIATLDAGNRATYQSQSFGDGFLKILGDVLEHPLWIPIHIMAALCLAFAYDIPEAIWAHCLSAGVLLLWGGVDLVIGVEFESPVSLLGPILVVIWGVGAGVVVRRWETILDERRPPIRRGR